MEREVYGIIRNRLGSVDLQNVEAFMLIIGNLLQDDENIEKLID